MLIKGTPCSYSGRVEYSMSLSFLLFLLYDCQDCLATISISTSILTSIPSIPHHITPHHTTAHHTTKHAHLTSEVAHDAVVYFCKMLGLAFLFFFLAHINELEGMRIDSASCFSCPSCFLEQGHNRGLRNLRPDVPHHTMPCQTFALFYLHTLA